MDKLWPTTAELDEQAELWLGGCKASDLARLHGTPLYLFDEATLRSRARAYQAALRRYYPGTAQTAYAAKAYLCTAIAQVFAEEGLDLDVVSGGELHVALASGFPPERIHFHGNNKTPAELEQAYAAGIGRIVVDNFLELERLGPLGERALARDRSIAIWLRLSPGIQAHTHAHIQTGHEDTKFGFSIASGDAERAVVRALQTPGLSLLGLHSHIGSQIYESEPLADAAGRVLEFAAAMRDRHAFVLRELSPGGGWGVPMTEGDPEAPIEPYVETLAAATMATCRAAGLELPHLVLEPGRSLVAPACVALYTVGARKEIPGVRTYVSADGGMADNIRPALYGASYSALAISGAANSADGNATGGPAAAETVTIAGKFCESGDVLIRDIALPRLSPGDLLAIPMTGAYTLSMASNYNLATRPAVLLLKDGGARLIQRRESPQDLVRRDVPLRSTGQQPHFYKYQALGNDYIVLDPAGWPDPPSAAAIRRICDRHAGVGSDGILWGPLAQQAPFPLRLFNPDGGEFEKSGNGLRIFARYLWDRGLPPGPDFEISTPGGPVTAHVLDGSGSRIAMDMGRLTFNSQAVPVAGVAREVIEERVSLPSQELRITAVGIGNPHCVVFLDQAAPIPAGFDHLVDLAHRLGPQLECLPLFPKHTNVQFVQAVDLHTLRIAIWERGAGYTLASGTSSCAAAGAAIRTGRCQSPVTVVMPGGSMLVEVAADWSVRLTGTVAPVCEGEISQEVLAAAITRGAGLPG